MTREAAAQRQVPNTVVMEMPNLDAKVARAMAREAVAMAQGSMPKMSGRAARGLSPVFGIGFFGIRWDDDYVWYQEMGIRAFTMRSLAGKVIPMWIDDPTGKERRKYPRARIRTTQSGKVQVLIFRKAAKQGERKQVTDRRTGQTRWVPKSYPGAPGRIAIREAAAPNTTAGRRGGAVARGNVGVRWRHPGLGQRYFLHNSLTQVAYFHGYQPGRVVTERGFRHRPGRVA